MREPLALARAQPHMLQCVIACGRTAFALSGMRASIRLIEKSANAIRCEGYGSAHWIALRLSRDDDAVVAKTSRAAPGLKSRVVQAFCLPAD
jgi:hypothetical protein